MVLAAAPDPIGSGQELFDWCLLPVDDPRCCHVPLIEGPEGWQARGPFRPRFSGPHPHKALNPGRPMSTFRGQSCSVPCWAPGSRFVFWFHPSLASLMPPVLALPQQQVKPGVPPNWPMILVSWWGANAYSLWVPRKRWEDLDPFSDAVSEA